MAKKTVLRRLKSDQNEDSKLAVKLSGTATECTDQNEDSTPAVKLSGTAIESTTTPTTLKKTMGTIISDQNEDSKPDGKPSGTAIKCTNASETANASTPTKRKKTSDPINTVSPKKRLGVLPTRLSVEQNSASLHLEVYGFHPILPIEAYLYIKDERNDGFMVGIKGFCEHNDPTNEALTKANFTSYLFRRLPNTNEKMVSSKNFPRTVVLRYVPTEISTKKTRQEGLQVLSKFLNSEQNTQFVSSKNIPTIDKTNEADPHALDCFFLDGDIESIIRNVFDEDELNMNFFSKYNQIALKLWSGTEYSDFARQLGFP